MCYKSVVKVQKKNGESTTFVYFCGMIAQKRPMRLRTMAYGLLIALLLVGCGDRISMRQLVQLESRVNDVPDSVLTVLTATDMPRWGERRALYALLTVQSQDKSYIDVADDSLISVATDYYQHRGLPLRRLQAFYYHGRVHVNAGRRHEAMTSYTRAMEFVDEVDAPYPVGLLFFQLSALYGDDFDYPQALDCMEKALNYFEKADKERLQYIAKRNMGLLHLNMHQFPQADSLLNEVLEWGEVYNDTYIIYNSIDQLLRLYDATENIEALDSLFYNYPPRTLAKDVSTYTTLAYYYAHKGEMNLSEEVLAQAWRMCTTAEDTAKLWTKSYLVGKLLGDKDMALRSHEYLLAHQDSVLRITLQQPLIASQRDYYQNRLEMEKLRNLNYRYLMGIATLVLVCLLAGIAIAALYIEQRRKRHYLHLQQELQRNQAKVYKMYESIEEKRDNGALMREQVLSLYRANLSHCIELFDKEEWATRLRKLSALRSKDVPTLTIKEREQLAEVLERCFINVITNLRDETATCKSKLAPEDVLLCLLSAIGSSTGVIRECLAASTDNVVNQRKKRLLDKLPSDVLSIFINKY